MNELYHSRVATEHIISLMTNIHLFIVLKNFEPQEILLFVILYIGKEMCFNICQN